KLIAPGFPDHHNSPAIGPPVFGRIRVNVQLELRYSINDGIVHHLTGLRLQNANAVVDVLVGSWAAAVDAGQYRSTAGQRHSWRECDERDKIASVQGQRAYLVLFDIQADLSTAGLQHGRARGNFNRL